jgi:hypothetical protein
MDIQFAYNLERLLFYMCGDTREVRNIMARVDDQFSFKQGAAGVYNRICIRICNFYCFFYSLYSLYFFNFFLSFCCLVLWGLFCFQGILLWYFLFFSLYSPINQLLSSSSWFVYFLSYSINVTLPIFTIILICYFLNMHRCTIGRKSYIKNERTFSICLCQRLRHFEYDENIQKRF